MQAAGVELTLADAMPDALLWNPDTDQLWVIEAVTSDGEVDIHKVNQMKSLADRCKKSGIGFTTTYRTWKEAAARQGKHTNIAVETYIWIQESAKKFMEKVRSVLLQRDQCQWPSQVLSIEQSKDNEGYVGP